MSEKTYDEYTVKPGDSFWSIANRHKIESSELKSFNQGLGARGPLSAFDQRDPPYGVSPGDIVRIPRRGASPTNPDSNSSDAKKADSIKEDCKDPCIKHDLEEPFIVAIAKDPTIQSKVPQTIGAYPQTTGVNFGQDLTYATDRTLPTDYSVGDNENALIKKMRCLLDEFAAEDSASMALRLFAAFWNKKNGIMIWTDATLDIAVSNHPYFRAFSEKALGAPGTLGANPSNPRIHQRLSQTGWDINKVARIEGLGVPAFNRGSKLLTTGDFSNGLGLMINGVQYVLITVEAYHYCSCEARYTINLRYELYDVFGLDDEDLQEYGAKNKFAVRAQEGISAWWQLQHQYGYAPLITKAVVRRSFTVSALN